MSSCAAFVCNRAEMVQGSGVGAEGVMPYAAFGCGEMGGWRVRLHLSGVISEFAGSAR